MCIELELSSDMWVFLSCKASQYAVFAVNCPEGVRAQISRSSSRVGLREIDRMDSTSIDRKERLMASESHSPFCWSIKLNIGKSEAIGGGGVTTR